MLQNRKALSDSIHMLSILPLRLRNVGGPGKKVSFLFLFFCFLQCAPRWHFLTDRHDLYAKTRVSGQGCAFWGSRQYLTTFRGSTPKNLPKMGQNRHFTTKSAKLAVKIAIYQSPLKIFASNFTHRSTTGAILEKCKIRSKGS